MIDGLLFDKDGTLFDFEASWTAWMVSVLDRMAGGEAATATSYGARIGFDYAAARFQPDSIAIAGTLAETASALKPGADPAELAAFSDWLEQMALGTDMVEAVPLRPYFEGLRGRGLALGVATNDTEAPARAHLHRAKVVDLLDFVAGADSGFGAKPAPGMCLGFAEAMALPPSRIAMVGDSRHDLLAGRAAGMWTVGVLTGMATEADLQDLADVVLPTIGDLPRWMDRVSAPGPAE